MSLWDRTVPTGQQDFHFPVCLSCLCPIRHKILGMLCKNPPFTKTTDPAPPFTKTTDSALCNEALVDQLWKLMNSGETDRDTWDTHTHTHTCAPDRMFNPLFKPRTALSNGGAVVASTVAKANRPPLKRRAVILCVRNVVNTLCHQKQKGTSCLCPIFPPSCQIHNLLVLCGCFQTQQQLQKVLSHHCHEDWMECLCGFIHNE